MDSNRAIRELLSGFKLWFYYRIESSGLISVVCPSPQRRHRARMKRTKPSPQTLRYITSTTAPFNRTKSPSPDTLNTSESLLDTTSIMLNRTVSARYMYCRYSIVCYRYSETGIYRGPGYFRIFGRYGAGRGGSNKPPSHTSITSKVHSFTTTFIPSLPVNPT